MKNELVAATKEHFLSHFGQTPTHIILSPGRINIIGEHVDYNDGFVLPAAIDKYVCFAIRPTQNNMIHLVAIDLNDSYQFDYTEPLQPIKKTWVNYILGILYQLKKSEKLPMGCEVAFSSNIPIGAGLSSSAALSCGICFAFNEVFSLGLTKKEIALIGQLSEHEFAGVKCGIMDQFASVFGKENEVIKLDCNTFEYKYFPANFNEYALLLLDSCVKHTHLTSGYNTRRMEVDTGLSQIKSHFPQVVSFRDCSSEMLQSIEPKMDALLFKRCLFVVQEIERVQLAVDALEKNDFVTLGKLMNATHEGLSREYEVSCDELDLLVSKAQEDKAVLGARMMGGGFGGCSINLIRKDAIEHFIKNISFAYYQHFNIHLKAYTINISNGTSTFEKP